MGGEMTVVPMEEARQLDPKEIKAQLDAILALQELVMKDGEDYGVIEGTGSKPTLLKAGAEKLKTMFRIADEPKIEDLSTGDNIRYRIVMRGLSIPSGIFLGSGVGECSSDEKKYKWREVVCPEEWDATPEDRKQVLWKKGWSGKPATSVQQVRANHADIANTILKMAKKRALVDLMLNITAASAIFTQDLDEMDPPAGGGKKGRQEVGASAAPAAPAPAGSAAPGVQAAAPATSSQAAPAALPAQLKGLVVEKLEIEQFKSKQGKDIKKFIVTFKGVGEFVTLSDGFMETARHARDQAMLVDLSWVPSQYRANERQIADMKIAVTAGA